MTVLLLSAAVVVLIVALGVAAWAGAVEVDWRATEGHWYFRSRGGSEIDVKNIPGHVLEITFGRFHAEFFIGRWA